MFRKILLINRTDLCQLLTVLFATCCNATYN